jgi:hypothetical protein
MVDIVFPVKGDESINETALEAWSDYLLYASIRAGKPLNNAKLHKQRLEEAGFEDVQENICLLPTNQFWPKEKKFKELGLWTSANLGENISGLSMALLTRYMGWSCNEVVDWADLIKEDFLNPHIHAVFEL